MRFYKKYRFAVGRKIEFRNLFGIVDAFLSEQGLQYDAMGYELLSLHDSCYKLVQKIPLLGPIERLADRNSDVFRLSNMTVPGHPCDDASIRLAGSKIPRPYNFFDTHFYYRNITFFGAQPSKEQMRLHTNQCYMDVYGSYIELYRSFEGPQTTVVYMMIEITDKMSCLGADNYAKFFSIHLGDIKYSCETKIYLDDAEEEIYDHLLEEATPIVKAAKDDLFDRTEQVREQMLQEFTTFEEKRFNLGSIVRRIGKRHGFSQFTNVPNRGSYISKTVDGGKFLSVEFHRFDGPGMDARLFLSGPGFSYSIADFSGGPENSEEANWFVSRMLEIVDYFEFKYMKQILALYPQSPDWSPICF